MKRFMPSSVMLTPFVVRVYPENEQEHPHQSRTKKPSQHLNPAWSKCTKFAKLCFIANRIG
ncbi:hypothetical protein [Vibrio navarrensis]|uniref:hypothetical protein n=1 Tax=Vibrio navarrensis TaxID=29495 RepID=UPI000A44DB2A|nr:hypothetical protein [Vibrio navarrensis]